jgi:ATP-binding cassette subfamily B protein
MRRIAALFRSDFADPVPVRRHPLLRLLSYARGFRMRIALATTCSVLNKVFDLAPPLLIGAAVDVVVKKQDSIIARLGFPDVIDQLWILAILTVIIWAIESLFEYLYAVFWRNLAQELQHEMRIDAYRHAQKLDMAYFEDRSTGGLMSILSDDVNQLERFLDGGANDLLQVSTTAIIVGAIFFALAPEVAWLAMAPMPFVIWGSLKFQRLVGPRYAEVRERVGLLNGQLANNLSGIATIKSFTSEEFEVDRISAESRAYQSANRRAIRLSSAFSPLIRMVIVVGFTATLVYGGAMVMREELAVGAYSVMVFLTQRLLWPFTRLGSTLDLYQRAMASTNRILNLLDAKPAVISGGTRINSNEIIGDVVFENLSFAYHRGLPVLRNLCLRMPAGQTTAIVGPTGSGKSTIIKLLLRLYEGGRGDWEESGRITIDSHDIRELHLHDLRRALALVSQDVFLFHGTVRDNIAYGVNRPSGSDSGNGNGEVGMDRIIAAAKAAEAHDFIVDNLPHGYETVVGERGQKLSGGQRQRIAMARAVLKDAPILILDEATSSVDNETEAAMQRSLQLVAVGRTTIIIAHRLSTVRNADRIYVLSGGAATEAGTHEQLLALNGLYAVLWRVQTGEGQSQTTQRPDNQTCGVR